VWSENILDIKLARYLVTLYIYLLILSFSDFTIHTKLKNTTDKQSQVSVVYDFLNERMRELISPIRCSMGSKQSKLLLWLFPTAPVLTRKAT
jgi:hypothetical protein